MKHNKKGFTLIEMMIVIAIIAVLVSVIIPIMNGSTDKAGAATNAANLRSVEGELVAMMLADPDAFGSWKSSKEDEYEGKIAVEDGIQAGIETLEAEVAALKANIAEYQARAQELSDLMTAAEGLAETLGLGSPSTWTEESAASGLANHSCGLICGYGWKCRKQEMYDTKIAYIGYKAEVNEIATNKAAAEADLLEKEAALNDAKNNSQGREDGYYNDIENLYTYAADEDGYITLDNGVKIKLPSAEKVNVGDVNVEKGTPMYVYLDQNRYEFVATYGGHNKNVFAQIAEGE